MFKFIIATLILLNISVVYAGSVTYSYDNLGRLIEITYSNGKKIKYTYDASGNRVTVVSAG